MKKSRRHALGQHFLRDPNILNKIAAAVQAAPGEAVLEIGAGKGPLTLALARAGARVVAVEIDAALAADMKAQKMEGVTIVEGDVLDLDWPALMKENRASDDPFAVAGNLPYSISSPILFRVLDLKDAISRAVFLIQREVAERITAGPGSKDYAPLGILLQIHFETKILFRLHPGSFSPRPKSNRRSSRLRSAGVRSSPSKTKPGSGYFSSPPSPSAARRCPTTWPPPAIPSRKSPAFSPA